MERLHGRKGCQYPRMLTCRHLNRELSRLHIRQCRPSASRSDGERTIHDANRHWDSWKRDLRLHTPVFDRCEQRQLTDCIEHESPSDHLCPCHELKHRTPKVTEAHLDRSQRLCPASSLDQTCVRWIGTVDSIRVHQIPWNGVGSINMHSMSPCAGQRRVHRKMLRLHFTQIRTTNPRSTGRDHSEWVGTGGLVRPGRPDGRDHSHPGNCDQSRQRSDCLHLGRPRDTSNWKSAGHTRHGPPYCAAYIKVFHCFPSISPKKGPVFPLPAGTASPG